MSDQHVVDLDHQIDRLGKWFVFGRKALAQQVRRQMSGLAERARISEEALVRQRTEVERLEAERCATLGELKSISASLVASHTRLSQVEDEKLRLEDRLGISVEAAARLGKELADSQQELKGLEREIETLRTIDKKFRLLNNALKSRPLANGALEEFRRLLDHDYFEFANREGSMVAEAAAYRRLQQVLVQLEQIAKFPGILTKTKGAIGGGFSSGKSAFVNSLMIARNAVRLPEGIKPVTAIPTFVVSGETTTVMGFSEKGGSFELGPQVFQELSHDFLKSFDFSLKDIVPYLTIETPLSDELFRHICLVDTPGYNPGSTGGNEDRDNETAKVTVRDADFLVWLVPARAGTLPQDDCEFINGLGFGTTRKLFVVVSRSDDKTQEDLEDIVDSIVDVLTDAGLSYEGIATHSSYHEFAEVHRKKSLKDFMRDQNKPNDRLTGLEAEIDGVFDDYRVAILGDRERSTKVSGILKSLSFDLETLGGGDAGSGKTRSKGNFLQQLFGSVRQIEESTKGDFQMRLDELRAALVADESEGLLREVEDLRRRFKEALRKVVGGQ